jgi:hypothetical protein
VFATITAFKMGKGIMMEKAILRRPLTDRVGVHRREEPCPRHGPILIQGIEGTTYVASCLACGLAGPEREDGWEAKLAFDEAFGTLRNVEVVAAYRG